MMKLEHSIKDAMTYVNMKSEKGALQFASDLQFEHGELVKGGISLNMGQGRSLTIDLAPRADGGMCQVKNEGFFDGFKTFAAHATPMDDGKSSVVIANTDGVAMRPIAFVGDPHDPIARGLNMSVLEDSNGKRFDDIRVSDDVKKGLEVLREELLQFGESSRIDPLAFGGLWDSDVEGPDLPGVPELTACFPICIVVGIISVILSGANPIVGIIVFLICVVLCLIVF